MGQSFVRLPPDSTGKKLLHSLFMYIRYEHTPAIAGFGETIEGSITGAKATIVYVDPTSTTITGYLGVMSDKYSDILFQQGEQILIDGVAHGTIAEIEAFYQPFTHIAGGNDTVNLVQVDNKGSMYMRFAEGEPQLDAFGNLKISDATKLGEYIFQHNTDEHSFETTVTNGGQLIHDKQIAGLILRCPTTNGASVGRSTHQYHRYQPGIGQTIKTTVSIGDDGKDNVIRRWGYYDDKDGVFFELNEHQLYAVVRSSVSGEIVERKWPQEEWNRDRLNGMGGHYNYSRFNMDVSKNVIYEIDFQWLGAGSVRFFVNVFGFRVCVHEVHNSGQFDVPYMRTGTLPFRFEQVNTAMTASTSEMKVFTGSVECDGKYDPYFTEHSNDVGPFTVTSTSFVPLFSIRAKKMINGVENRGQAYLQTADIYSTAPVIIILVKDATLVGDAWELSGGDTSILEMDTETTEYSGGKRLYSEIVGANEVAHAALDRIFSVSAELAIRRHADIEKYFTYTVAAKLLSAGTATINMSCIWEEVL